MDAQPYPTDLTDAEWDLIKNWIPPPKPGGRHRERDMRAVVNAIFSVVAGGIKWRMLPHAYPKWPRVYWYFSQGRDLIRTQKSQKGKDREDTKPYWIVIKWTMNCTGQSSAEHAQHKSERGAPQHGRRVRHIWPD